MFYRELKPTGAAAQFVKCFWMLEERSTTPSTQRILPDGRCELILNLAEPFEALTARGWESQPQAFVVGQITKPMMLRTRGAAKAIGIRFQPDGASALLKIPADELTDEQVSLTDLSRVLTEQLECLRDSESPILERLDQLISNPAAQVPLDRQIAYAASEFQRSSGTIAISEMARQLGLSARQLERRFKAAVGVSPKLFCRMQRFQRVFRAMESNVFDWVSVAIDCGYYDQAHLIRDFQQFAGCAPTSLLNSEIRLARSFAS